MLTSNYRPISSLTSLSKIFEKLIQKRLFLYLDKYKLLSSKQFGFRPSYQTVDAVTELLEQIRNGVGNNSKAYSVFLDLKKSVWYCQPQILLRKMEKYGIRGVTLDLFRSYLSERSQYVDINGHLSQKKQILCGVPRDLYLVHCFF